MICTAWMNALSDTQPTHSVNALEAACLWSPNIFTYLNQETILYNQFKTKAAPPTLPYLDTHSLCNWVIHDQDFPTNVKQWSDSVTFTNFCKVVLQHQLNATLIIFVNNNVNNNNNNNNNNTTTHSSYAACYISARSQCTVQNINGGFEYYKHYKQLKFAILMPNNHNQSAQINLPLT